MPPNCSPRARRPSVRCAGGRSRDRMAARRAAWHQPAHRSGLQQGARGSLLRSRRDRGPPRAGIDRSDRCCDDRGPRAPIARSHARGARAAGVALRPSVIMQPLYAAASRLRPTGRGRAQSKRPAPPPTNIAFRTPGRRICRPATRNAPAETSPGSPENRIMSATVTSTATARKACQGQRTDPCHYAADR